MRATPPDVLTDIQRAARFLYLQRLSIRGSPTSSGFAVGAKSIGVPGSNPDHLNPDLLRRRLRAVARRLNRVTIEGLDWAECIRRYDRETALFYLDPPYPGSEAIYGSNLFSSADFETMARILASLKGRFILSFPAGDVADGLFGRYPREAFPVTAFSRASASSQRVELLIQGGGESGSAGAARDDKEGAA